MQTFLGFQGKKYSKRFKMSSRKTATRRGTTKKRAQRATSNVFAMFNQDQIQEFKEAFNMIDQNRDGFVDKEDLHDMLASLGKDPTDEYLEAMMNEAPGAINFTMFLTLFGEKLQGTDPEDVIKNAFGCFDEENNGGIHEDHLRELLTTMGDRFTGTCTVPILAYKIDFAGLDVCYLLTLVTFGIFFQDQ